MSNSPQHQHHHQHHHHQSNRYSSLTASTLLNSTIASEEDSFLLDTAAVSGKLSGDLAVNIDSKRPVSTEGCNHYDNGSINDDDDFMSDYGIDSKSSAAILSFKQPPSLHRMHSSRSSHSGSVRSDHSNVSNSYSHIRRADSINGKNRFGQFSFKTHKTDNHSIDSTSTLFNVNNTNLHHLGQHDRNMSIDSISSLPPPISGNFNNLHNINNLQPSISSNNSAASHSYLNPQSSRLHNSVRLDHNKKNNYNNNSSNYNNNNYNNNDNNKRIQRFIDTIVCASRSRVHSADAFFDEFSYNIIISQFLSEKVLISNYSQDATSGKGSLLMLQQPMLDCLQRKSDETPQLFKSLNISKYNETFKIQLPDNFHYKLILLFYSLVGFKKVVLNSSSFVSSSNPIKHVYTKIFTLVCLINLKNLILCKSVYQSIMQIKVLNCWSQFFKHNKQLDLFYKKNILHLKEFEIYSQVSFANGSFNRSNNILPNGSNSSALSVLKTPQHAQRLIAYLAENLSLLSNFLLVKISKNISLALNEQHGADALKRLKSALHNYFTVYKVNVQRLLAIANAFSLLISDSSPMTQQQLLANMSLKPLQLASRSPKLNPNVNINVELNRSRNNSITASSDISSDHNIPSLFHQSLKNFENKFDEFHLVRKFYLILWLVIINNEPPMVDETDVAEVQDKLSDDEIAISNLLKSLMTVNGCIKESNDFSRSCSPVLKASLLTPLNDSFKGCQEYVSQVYDVSTNYFKYHGLSKLLNGNIVTVTTPGHKKDTLSEISNTPSANDNLHTPELEIIDNLSLNLNRINYKLNSFSLSSSCSTTSDFKLASHSEFGMENHKQLMNDLNSIENDLNRVLNVYQTNLSEFKLKVSKSVKVNHRHSPNYSHAPKDSIDGTLSDESAVQSKSKRYSLPVGSKFNMLSMYNEETNLRKQQQLDKLNSPGLSEKDSSTIDENQCDSAAATAVSQFSRGSPRNKSKSYKRLSTGLSFSLLKISEDSLTQSQNESVDEKFRFQQRPNKRVVSYDDNYVGIYSKVDRSGKRNENATWSAQRNMLRLSNHYQPSNRYIDDQDYYNQGENDDYNFSANNSYSNISQDIFMHQETDEADEADESRLTKAELENVLNSKFGHMVESARNHLPKQKDDESHNPNKKANQQHSGNVTTSQSQEYPNINDNAEPSSDFASNNNIDQQFFLSELRKNIPKSPTEGDDVSSDAST